MKNRRKEIDHARAEKRSEVANLQEQIPRLGIRPNSGWRIHTSANSSTLKSTSQSGSCLGSERDKLESCAFGRNNAKSSIRTAVDPGDVSGFAWRGSLGLQTSACEGQAVAIMRLSAAALGLAALLQKGQRLTRRRSSEARSVRAQRLGLYWKSWLANYAV